MSNPHFLNDYDEGHQEIEALVTRLADEFIEKLDRGEDPQIEVYSRMYPHAQRFIRQTLGALETMRSMDLAVLGLNEDPTEQADLRPNAIGDFRLIRLIGKGGMGVVYEAEQLSLSRRVALKVLPYAAMLDDRALQRFKNEVTAAAHLNHTNIVDIYGVGVDKGVHHYSMRLIDGVTLSDVIAELQLRCGRQSSLPSSLSEVSGEMCNRARRSENSHRQLESGKKFSSASGTWVGPLWPDETVAAHVQETIRQAHQPPGHFRSIAEFGATVADALHHAHENGVIHRDVKPSNLLLDRSGKPWITDFGLAQVETGTAVTMAGDLLGTARYMSPEQVMANRVVVDHRTDVYSLGVTLFELLTLQLPFVGATRQELFRKIAFADPKPLRKLNPTVPRDLETIVRRAMAKDPNARFTTASELADDLRRFANVQPIKSRPPTLYSRVTKWHRRNAAASLASLAVALIAAVLLGVVAIVIGVKQSETSNALTQSRQRLVMTLAAIDTMHRQLATMALSSAPELNEDTRSLLETDVDFFVRFAKESATEPALQFEAARSFARAGEVLSTLSVDQFESGHGHQAIHCFEQSIQLFRQVRARDPDHEESTYYLAFCNNELARCLKAVAPDQAIGYFQRTIALVAEIDSPRGQILLGESLNDLALHLLVQRELSQVPDLLKRSESVFRRMLERSPTNPWLTSSYATSWRHLGDYHLHSRQLLAAIGPLQKAIENYESISATNEFVPEGYGSLRYAEYIHASWRGLHDSYEHLAQIFLRLGNREMAKQTYQRAMKFWEDQLVEFPDDPTNLNRLAWLKATCPIKELCDPGAAIELGKRGVEVAPNYGACWDTLAAAYCYDGQWQLVLTPAARSIDLYGREKGVTCIMYIAIAQWNLGKRDSATKLFQECVEILNKRNPSMLEFYRIFLDAADVLNFDRAKIDGSLAWFYAEG